MCLLVYIASDQPLPLIPWKTDAPGFHVRELGDLGEDEVKMRQHFSKPFVYYIGSHEKCGCGFRYGQMPLEFEDDDDRKEDAAARESVLHLREYLSKVVENGQVELYACWPEEQTLEPTSHATIIPLDIGSNDTEFTFKERELLTILKPKS